MLTKEQIEEKATFLRAMGDAPLFVGGFIEGATWANETLSARIAELQTANSELEDLLCLAKTHLKSVLSATKTGAIIPVEFLEKEIAKFEKHTEQ